MDAYWRKRFLWMLKVELDGPPVRPSFFYALRDIGEYVYYPARHPTTERKLREPA